MSDSTELLRRCEQALTHWVRTYAPEMCDGGKVAETYEFMMRNGGTLYFIAKLREDILLHLNQQEHK